MNVLLILCGQSEYSIPRTFRTEHQLVGAGDPDAGWLEPISTSGTRCLYVLSQLCICNIGMRVY